MTDGFWIVELYNKNSFENEFVYGSMINGKSYAVV